MVFIEEWKDIEGYEGYYQISNFGNVKNSKTNHIIKLSDINSVGYYRVTLYNPIKKRFFVHRLVAYHFCDDYEENLIVNHKDGNKKNNHASNLEWVTRSENDLHAFKNNLRQITGSAIKQKEKSKRKVILTDINTNEKIIFNNYIECANYFILSKEYVKQCCRGMYLLKRKYMARYEESA